MAEKKKSAVALHDEQTSAAAESLRAAIRDVRGGMTQAQTETLLEKLEGIARGLDEQGKMPEEVEEMHEENNEPDPNKTAAEMLLETIQADPDAAKNFAGNNISSPGVPGGITTQMKDLGQPAVKAQDSSENRDIVEKEASKKADIDPKSSKK